MMRLFRKRVANYDRNVPESGPPMGPPPSVPDLLAPPVAPLTRMLTDYRADGPEEARQIALGHRACETAPNGTGSRCSCSFHCANCWLRASGYKAG